MGLDNGFIVKSDKRTITRANLPEGINYPFKEDYNGQVEIVYWRKCWGMRNQVMNHFGWRETSPEQYRFEIEKPEQVIELIEIIASWLDEERWEDDADSIWDYKEMREVLIQNIINFSIIYTLMLGNPDVYLEFYDSY